MRSFLILLSAAALLPCCLAEVSITHPAGASKTLLPLSGPAIGRDTRFAPMRADCTIFQPPRLIAGRAVSVASTSRTLVIDLIVLNSGNVDNAFIVEGGEPSANDEILKMISGWRYQPATCDGNPIEAEGRIQLRLESSLSTGTSKSE